MKETAAIVVALIVAPLVAATAFAMLTPVKGGDLIAAGLIPICYFFGFLATFFVGMPIFLVLRHFDLATWWTSLGAGMSVGALTGIVLRLPNASSLSDLSLLIFIGAMSAISFWAIWKLGKPASRPLG